MNFSGLWRGQSGRIAYLAALLVFSACIVVLPYVSAKTAAMYAGGPDPALSVVRMMLRPLIIGAGLAAAGGPLTFFARRRLRELDLSGAWLVVFPIAPLLSLFAFASSGMVLWPLPVNSPVFSASFQMEVAFGMLLAVLPAGDHLRRLGHTGETLREMTRCDGRLGRRPYLLRLAVALGATIVLSVIGLMTLRTSLPLPAGQAPSTWGTALGLFGSLANLFLSMFVIAATVRRLHDLDMKGTWLALIALAYLGMGPFAMVLFKPTLIAYLFSIQNPVMLLSSLLGIGGLVLTIVLIVKGGSAANNRYDSPDALLSN